VRLCPCFGSPVSASRVCLWCVVFFLCFATQLTMGVAIDCFSWSFGFSQWIVYVLDMRCFGFLVSRLVYGVKILGIFLSGGFTANLGLFGYHV
jgi:hypothetical protein